jgi:hypothetical protein
MVPQTVELRLEGKSGYIVEKKPEKPGVVVLMIVA